MAPSCLSIGKVRNQKSGWGQSAERDRVVGQEVRGSRCEIRGAVCDGSVSKLLRIDSGECKRARQPASWIGRQLLAPSDDEATGLSVDQGRAALRQEALCLAGLQG